MLDCCIVKPFWSSCGIDTPIFASPPLGGGLGHAALQQPTWPLAAIWCHTALSLSAFWRFREQAQWSSLNHHIMPNFERQAIEQSMSTQPAHILSLGDPLSASMYMTHWCLSSALQVHNLSSPQTCGERSRFASRLFRNLLMMP